jgi:hypothetical protein
VEGEEDLQGFMHKRRLYMGYMRRNKCMKRRKGPQNAIRRCISRRTLRSKSIDQGSIKPVSTLQVLSDGGEDGTERGANSGEAEAGDKLNNVGGQLDEEVLAVLADDVEEVLDGLGDVLDEVTEGRGLSNDGANGAGDGGETEASDEGGNGGGELDEDLLGVLAGDDQGVLDLGGNVLDDLAALDVLAESSNDGTDGDTNGRETEAGNETGNRGGEFDEESTNVSADDGNKVVHDGAEAGDELTEAGGGGDDGAEGNTEGTETEAGDEGGHLGGELDEQDAGVRADNGQDVVELGAEVLDEVAAVEGGDAAGRGHVSDGGEAAGQGEVAGGGQVTGGGDAAGQGEVAERGQAVGGGLGGKVVENLSNLTDLGDLGELVELELLGDVADLEALKEAINTGSRGGGSECRAGQSGNGGDERGLHCEINGYIELKE